MEPQKVKERKKVTIIAVSDTHGSMKVLTEISKLQGDIFIHAGDFTNHGKDKNFLMFFQFLDSLKFKHKIVVAGNHQIILDNGTMKTRYRNKFLEKYPCKFQKQEVLNELKKRCIYLQHESIVIEDIHIFGSPYTPVYCNTAFQYEAKNDGLIWSKVPEKVDILITHGPPYGILDRTFKGANVGSKELRSVSLNRNPRYHIFGHIHEAQGLDIKKNITFVNVAKQPTKLIF